MSDGAKGTVPFNPRFYSKLFSPAAAIERVVAGEVNLIAIE